MLANKWPTADFAVELEGHPGKFFLVQVKSTQRGYTKKGRLKVKAELKKVTKLLSGPVPAYLVAVDEPNEAVFIVVPRRNRRVTSVSAAYSLTDPKVRRTLWQETRTFWIAAGRKRNRSAFLDK